MRDNVSRELMQRLQKEGTGLQDWMLKNNVEAEKMQDEVNQESIDRAKRDMALEALFKEKGWEVTDEDIAGSSPGSRTRRPRSPSSRKRIAWQTCARCAVSPWRLAGLPRRPISRSSSSFSLH